MQEHMTISLVIVQVNLIDNQNTIHLCRVSLVFDLWIDHTSLVKNALQSLLWMVRLGPIL
jgi:hypothetical protein